MSDGQTRAELWKDHHISGQHSRDKESAPVKAKAADDPVDHPSHYTRGKIEVLDFIEDQKLGFHRGQVVKYVCRAGWKEGSPLVEDLKKAKIYLDRLIKLEEGHTE